MFDMDEVLERDISQEFINMMQIFSGDDFKPKFIEHMINAMMMSHFKYGWVKDKPYSHYKMLAGFENKAYQKDQNDEHLVNLANYAMMCYMTDEPRQEYIDAAVEYMRDYSENRYTGTDSDKSVNHKPQPVNTHLRKILEDSPFDLFPPIDDLIHLQIY